MKPNWTLIASSLLFVVAVFAAAVLDGFDATAPYVVTASETPVAAR